MVQRTFEDAMQIPNAEFAVIDIEKLTEYCLNPDHPRGKHKARVFQTACGYTQNNAFDLRAQLLEIAMKEDATEFLQTGFGQRFMIECVIKGPSGEATIRTAWIIRGGENFPRFVSAYIV
jgi:hypothetical protein